MNIAIDYDQTYTRDPEMWNEFIGLAKTCGHTVYCVTMRYSLEGYDVRSALQDKVNYIYFTGRKAKKEFMFKQEIAIDVWIDDTPFFILNDAAS